MSQYNTSGLLHPLWIDGLCRNIIVSLYRLVGDTIITDNYPNLLIKSFPILDYFTRRYPLPIWVIYNETQVIIHNCKLVPKVSAEACEYSVYMINGKCKYLTSHQKLLHY